MPGHAPKRDKPAGQTGKLSYPNQKQGGRENMKKRLLSAALALAMVLTLIPATVVPAFAAASLAQTAITNNNDANLNAHKTSVRYFSLGQLPVVNAKMEPGWYLVDTWSSTGDTIYYPVQVGVMAGGTWYASAQAAVSANQYSFTLLAGSASLSSWGTAASVALNVDMNGFDLTVPAWESKVASITLTDPNLLDHQSLSTPRGKGTLTMMSNFTKNDGTKAFTLSATNADVSGAISLTGNRNTVILNNAEVKSGGITLNGTTVNGTTTTYTGQSLQASNGSKIGGAVTITGDSNTITLSNTQMTGDGANANFTVNASGGNIQISDNSSVGTLTVGPHTGQNVNSTLPSVTVTGSSVWQMNRTAPVTGNPGTAISTRNSFTISGNSSVPAGISTNFGDVSITNSTVATEATARVSVGSGSLTLSGANLAGSLKLGDTTADAVRLSITGTNNTIGAAGITKIGSINGQGNPFNPPADPNNGNIWGEITDSTNEAINKITGGTFKGSVPNNWLVNSGNDARAFELKVGSNYTYHSQDQLGDILSTQQLNSGTITYVPTKDTMAKQTISFYNNSERLGVVRGVSYVPIVLPAKVADRGTPSWYYNTVSYEAGSTITTGTATSVRIDAQLTSSVITKLTDVKVSTANLKDSLRAALAQTADGGTITLSGGVAAAGNTPITLDLTTDMVLDDSGTAKTVVLEDLDVVYNSATGAVTFSADNAAEDTYKDYGVTFEATSSGLTILRLSNGKKYSLANGGISVIPSNLKIAGVDKDSDGGTNTAKTVVATVNIGTLGQAGQKALADKIQTGAVFNWVNNSPAMVQALNAQAARITPTQITNWINQARQAAWRTRYNGTGNASELATTGYDEVWLVPYLAMTVTQQSDDGTMTATLTPSFRVEVRQSAAGLTTAKSNGFENPFTKLNTTNPTQYPFVDRYVAQQGQSLGELIGDLGTVYVRLGTAVQTTYSGTYMHQDGTYVYYSSDGLFRITNAGKTGLGSVVINKTANTVTLTRKPKTNGNDGNGALTLRYDNLQAAVDQTKKQTYTPNATPAVDNCDLITIKQAYTGSATIDVTGEARTFKVTTEGNHSLTAANNNFTVTPQTTGKDWLVQLTKDTAVSTRANITINSATGGTASVSKNPANYGDTVTITLSASAGYTASGVSVTTSSGQSVSVSGSGSTYTFTMPSGSVTVTPSFTRTQQTNPTIVVNNTTTGTATTSAGSSQVAPGTQVTVTTSPAQGQRTMGVNVTGATATRTGANTFTFTVPSGYSTVTVTPRFDVNNGTLFEDVWSTEYYSTPVAWAVGRGITQGDGSVYRFGTGKTCTREDMVTFLWRSQGSPVVNVSNPFWDVQPGSYYYNAVLWAVSKGITKGVSANQFGVGRNVIRADAVTFLYRMAGSPNASASGSFYDVPSNQYYAKAVNWAVSKGITNGDGSTVRFNPYGNCLREQIVTFLYRDLV